MIGFPKLLVSKQDYLNALSLDPKKGREAISKLRQAAWIWQQDRVLEEGDEGSTSETERVDVIQDQDTGEETRVQMVYKEDQNAEFYRLGFTQAEFLSLTQKHPEE